MDYVFFGFSALCFGFVLLLLFVLSSQPGSHLRAVHLLISGGAAIIYYYLEISVFRNSIILYYLANSVPQIVLLILIALVLNRYRKQRGS